MHSAAWPQATRPKIGMGTQGAPGRGPPRAGATTRCTGACRRAATRATQTGPRACASSAPWCRRCTAAACEWSWTWCTTTHSTLRVTARAQPYPTLILACAWRPRGRPVPAAVCRGAPCTVQHRAVHSALGGAWLSLGSKPCKSRTALRPGWPVGTLEGWGALRRCGSTIVSAGEASAPSYVHAA